MEYSVLGWAEDGPTLRLDHEAFAYAGKFVMSSTGKAVARDDEVVAAASFSPDRTEPDRLQIRYVTVRADRQGEGIGPRLLRFLAERARTRYETVSIGANNPFAYEACYRAGFVFTGRSRQLGELDLVYRPEVTPARDTYQAGLDRYRSRDLSDREMAFLDSRRDRDPPTVVSVETAQ